MKQMSSTIGGCVVLTIPRAMRYAEVLLLAAEASLQSGNASKAAGYVNKVRDRAQLPALGSVSMDDIKKEKRLELGWKAAVTRI